MSELLALNDNEEIKVGFNNNDLSPIYDYKDIKFIPTERAFEIRFENVSNELLSIANNALVKLLNTLPFTPNRLVGFNYSVDESLDITGVSIPKYSGSFNLSEIKLTRNEVDYDLNIIIDCKNTQSIAYNFHYSDLSKITDTTIFEHVKYLKEQWAQI